MIKILISLIFLLFANLISAQDRVFEAEGQCFEFEIRGEETLLIDNIKLEEKNYLSESLKENIETMVSISPHSNQCSGGQVTIMSISKQDIFKNNNKISAMTSECISKNKKDVKICHAIRWSDRCGAEGGLWHRFWRPQDDGTYSDAVDIDACFDANGDKKKEEIIGNIKKENNIIKPYPRRSREELSKEKKQ